MISGTLAANLAYTVFQAAQAFPTEHQDLEEYAWEYRARSEDPLEYSRVTSRLQVRVIEKHEEQPSNSFCDHEHEYTKACVDVVFELFRDGFFTLRREFTVFDTEMGAVAWEQVEYDFKRNDTCINGPDWTEIVINSVRQAREWAVEQIPSNDDNDNDN